MKNKKKDKKVSEISILHKCKVFFYLKKDFNFGNMGGMGGMPGMPGMEGMVGGDEDDEEEGNLDDLDKEEDVEGEKKE